MNSWVVLVISEVDQAHLASYWGLFVNVTDLIISISSVCYDAYWKFKH
jgi:hypothetical protein